MSSRESVRENGLLMASAILFVFALSFLSESSFAPEVSRLWSSSAAATSAFPLASNFLTPAFGVLLIVFSLLLSVATKFETDSSKVGALYIFSVFTAGVNFYILMNRSLFLPVPFLFMGLCYLSLSLATL